MAGNEVGTRLSGKTCFVTAAGQGVGRAIAQHFAAEGARVIAADSQFDEKTLPDERVVRRILDASDERAVIAAAGEYTDVSVLVNCVGVVANGALPDCSADAFDRSMSINVRTMALTCRAFLAGMLRRRHGSIINVASVVSCAVAAPDRFAYGTSKAAVTGLTMSIARDYVSQGIRCNAISLHGQPTGRRGRAEEVAAVAVLLASDEAPFMTGANVGINGGMSL